LANAAGYQHDRRRVYILTPVLRPDRPRGRLPGIEIKAGLLKQARLDAGMSLAQVAGSELTRQAVHLIEQGKVRPSLQNLQVIANRLGVPVGSLLARPERDRLSLEDAAIAELDHLSQARDFVRTADRARDLIGWGGSPRLLAFAHCYLGQALTGLSRAEEALDHLREARARFDLVDNPWFVAECMDWEAAALHLMDDPAALDVGHEALRLYRLLDPRDIETEARMLEHIGTILQRRKDFARAREHYDEALRVAGTLHDLLRTGRRYHGLAICYIGLGDRRRGAELLATAMKLYEAQHQISPVPARTLLPTVENDLGMLLMEQGDLDRSSELLQSALAHFEEAGTERSRSYVLLSLAELRHRQGRLPEAVDLCQQAMGQAERLNETQALAAAYKQLGELHAALGEHALADRRFRTALDICERAGLTERQALYVEAYQRMRERRSRGGRHGRQTGA
jgi:tetratricopeptide (TPR) repeat protein